MQNANDKTSWTDNLKVVLDIQEISWDLSSSQRTRSSKRNGNISSMLCCYPEVGTDDLASSWSKMLRRYPSCCGRGGTERAWNLGCSFSLFQYPSLWSICWWFVLLFQFGLWPWGELHKRTFLGGDQPLMLCGGDAYPKIDLESRSTEAYL